MSQRDRTVRGGVIAGLTQGYAPLDTVRSHTRHRTKSLLGVKGSGAQS
jgi:hypothetical protein